MPKFRPESSTFIGKIPYIIAKSYMNAEVGFLTLVPHPTTLSAKP